MKKRVKSPKKSIVSAVEIEADQVFTTAVSAEDLCLYNEIDGWMQLEIAFKHKVNRPKIKRDKLIFRPGFFSFSGYE